MRPKRAILLTLCSRRARDYGGALELARMLQVEGGMGTRTIGLHVASPNLDTHADGGVGRAALSEVGRALREGLYPLISMGWSGAPWHLLEPAEVEWELTWSCTNHWDNGAQQLWNVAPSAFLPRGCTAAQMRLAAARFALPVLAGAALGEHVQGPAASSQPPLPALYQLLHPTAATATSVVAHRFATPPRATEPTDEKPAELVHLVVTDPFLFLKSDWKRQVDLWARQSDWVDFDAILAEPPNSTPLSAPPPAAVPPILALNETLDPLTRSDVATYHRHRAAIQRNRIRSILEALGLDPPPPPQPLQPTVPPLQTNSGGSAAGAVTLSESGLAALFLGGRLAQLTTRNNGHDRQLLPLHRAQSYLCPSTHGGALAYGETTTAAWFETETLRGLFEQTRLSGPLGEPISTTTTSMIVAGSPVLYQLIEVKIPADFDAARLANWTPLQMTLAKGDDAARNVRVTRVTHTSLVGQVVGESVFDNQHDSAVIAGELLRIDSDAAALYVGAWSGAGPLIWPFTLCWSTGDGRRELRAHPLWLAADTLSAALTGARATIVLSFSAQEPPRELPRQIAARAAGATLVFDWAPRRSDR